MKEKLNKVDINLIKENLINNNGYFFKEFYIKKIYKIFEKNIEISINHNVKNNISNEDIFQLIKNTIDNYSHILNKTFRKTQIGLDDSQINILLRIYNALYNLYKMSTIESIRYDFSKTTFYKYNTYLKHGTSKTNTTCLLFNIFFQ